jgi:hypothetical protein
MQYDSLATSRVMAAHHDSFLNSRIISFTNPFTLLRTPLRQALVVVRKQVVALHGIRIDDI